MRSQVVQLQPNPAPFESAVAAYREGRPIRCIELLRGRDELPARVLRARASLRTGETALGLETLVSASIATFASYRDQGEYLLMRGVLQSRSGDYESAKSSFDVARPYAFGSPSGALEAEYHYYDGVRHFELADFDNARAAVNRALEIEPNPLGERDDYFVELGNSRARSLQLLGLVSATKARYREQLSYIRAAIDELDTVIVADRWLSATLMMNLSFLVRDFDLVEDAAFLRSQFVQDWPRDLGLMAFHIMRSLGWSCALRGDHVGAFRDFRWCADNAPSPAQVVWASADRAFLGTELGEATFARDELDRAAEIARTIDWNAIRTDDRPALMVLARQMARTDPVRARGLFESYRRLTTKVAPTYLNATDRRVRAYEQYTDGLILRHSDSRELARPRFIECFSIWNELDYRWLAATAAIELAELDADASFLEYARIEAAARPNSWLSRRVETLLAQLE